MNAYDEYKVSDFKETLIYQRLYGINEAGFGKKQPNSNIYPFFVQK